MQTGSLPSAPPSPQLPLPAPAPPPEEFKFPDSEIPGRPRGIPNVENSCFANAAIQCISACLNAARSFTIPTTLVNGAENPFLAVLRELWNGASGSINPQKLLDHFESCIPDMNNRGGEQQDMNTIVLGLFEHYLSPHESRRLFGFDLVTEIKCLVPNCNREKRVANPALSIELPVTGETRDVGLMELLKSYHRPSILESAWRHECIPDAEAHAQNRCLIPNSPECLVVQLVRYAFDRSRLAGRVHTVAVNYPERMQYNGCEYKLVAVGLHVNRNDPNEMRGHYVARVRYQDQWWKCDDTKVTKIGATLIGRRDKARPTMLFYHRLTEAEIKAEDGTFLSVVVLLCCSCCCCYSYYCWCCFCCSSALKEPTIQTQNARSLV